MIDLQWSKPSNHYRSSEWIQISFNFSEYVIGWLVEWNKYSSASTGVTRQTTSFCCLCTRRGEQWLWGGSAKGRWVRSIGEKCPSESHQHERPRAPRWRCWPNWRTAAWGVAGREGERCFNIWWERWIALESWGQQHRGAPPSIRFSSAEPDASSWRSLDISTGISTILVTPLFAAN